MSNTQGRDINQAGWERWASAIGGGALATYGLMRRDKTGLALAMTGAALIARGSTGHCPAYGALGIDRSGKPDFDTSGVPRGTERQEKPVADSGHSLEGPKGVAHESGIKVHKAITVGKPASELYAFWRNFENLPRFMNHLDSVTVQDGKKSHWVAKAPLGRTVEWDAEIINEVPDTLIAWRSLPGAQVESTGAVRFLAAPGGRGTEVHVDLSYQPPLGQFGAAVAKLFGQEPNQQVDNDLRHFRNLMEAGELPTVEGQTHGKRSLSARVLQSAVEEKIR